MENGKEKNCKVIVAGHSCLDITPVFPRKACSGLPGEILSPGKLVQMDGVEISAGGAVSNTGIAMKLLGNDVSLLTKMGADDFGVLLKNIYNKYGVTEGMLSVPGEQTSYSVVLAIPGVDRIFLHDPGCNNTFDLEDVKKADFDGVKLFHFGYPPLMRKLFADQGAELTAMFEYVGSKGIITSLDMAAVDPESEAGKVDWNLILKNTLPYVDVFVPSVEELCFMLDPQRLEEWNRRAKGGDVVDVLTLEDIEPLAETCMEYGVKVLLLKCGTPGLYYRIAGADALQKMKDVIDLPVDEWADRKGFEASFKPEKVLSATGAGDTTIAAFLTSLLSGRTLKQAVSLAAAEGASCVESYGAMDGIRTLPELEKKIADGWEKNMGL